MTSVYLIRHAEAEGNLYRRCHGWYNSLVTDNGYRQIAALEKRFEGVQIDAVYSSDLFRTMTTAGAIYKPRGLVLHTDKDLREIHSGVWEDKTWGELWQEDPRGLDAFNHSDPAWQVQGSETFGSTQMRAVGAIRRIAARHDGQTVAIVAHGTVIRTSLAKLMGYGLDEIIKVPHGDNTCVAKLNFDGGRAVVEYFNDNSHLGELSTMARQGWWKHEGKPFDFSSENLWFRPLEFGSEGRFYAAAREDAWRLIHGGLEGYDGPGFLAQARDSSAMNRESVLAVMKKDALVGVLQLELDDTRDGAGQIPFFYLAPEVREQGLGVQLLGQAVSEYRPLGKEKLQLRCAPENRLAHRFYERYGFLKVGEETGSRGRLDVMEKYIGYGLG